MENEQWLYQVRIRVNQEISEKLRKKEKKGTSKEIFNIAKEFSTTPVCTFDAFYEYCKEAEELGIEKYPLYHWTKKTIEDPKKKIKHSKSFAFYTSNDQVYEKSLAQALYNKLKPLLDQGFIEELRLIDSNPKNNPQPPT